MEIYPWSEDGAKYGYTMTAIVTTIITGAWLQYTGAWLPFLVASLWAAFLFYDLYLVDFLAGNEAVSEEDKAMVAQTQFMKDTMGMDAKKARKERQELDKLLKEVRRERQELEAEREKINVEVVDGKE